MNDYENIAAMTKEFNADFDASSMAEFPPSDSSFWATWQCRILLAIAQQLSVIAGRLKPPEG